MKRYLVFTGWAKVRWTSWPRLAGPSHSTTTSVGLSKPLQEK